MRSPKGARDYISFAALVLSGYVAARLIGIGEPFAFLFTVAVALTGWAVVSRLTGPPER